LLAAKPDIYDILRNLIVAREGNNDIDAELRVLLVGALYNLRQPQIEEELLRFGVPILLDALSFPVREQTSFIRQIHTILLLSLIDSNQPDI